MNGNMTGKDSKVSEKRSEFEEKKMSDVCLAADLVRQVEPREHRSVKEWIGVTARRLGWPYSRTKAVWYGDARRIDAGEMEALKAAQKHVEIRKLGHEYEDITSRIERLQAALAVVSEEIRRGDFAALEQTLSERRSMVPPGDNGE